MSDDEYKKESEKEQLMHFLFAYSQVTGTVLSQITDHEAPDFKAKDASGRTVGIELTSIKFDPRDMSYRQIIEGEEWASAEDAYWDLLRLFSKKEKLTAKSSWSDCIYKILVFVLIDIPVDAFLHSVDVDRPNGQGFDEVWLADSTKLEAFYGFDLMPIVHPNLSGLFPVAPKDRKPYG